MTQPQALQNPSFGPSLMVAMEAATLAAESRAAAAPSSQRWASRIIREALATHGSRSQCDCDLLMRQIDYRSLTLDAFIKAADEAAAELVGV